MRKNRFAQERTSPLETEQVDISNAGKKPSGFTKFCFEWAEAIVTAIVIVIVLFTFVFRIVNVRGESMMDTIHDRDKVVLTNLFYTPEPGDIVVITRSAQMDEPIIKRVIAVGGQTLQIDFDTGEVYVDGVLLDEPYIRTPTTTQGDMEIPEVIPEGYVFVMGDNRSDSIDSRFERIGLIDERNILGKAQFIIFPFDRIGGLY